ncbi:unnamed protein product, partial [Symbiodinium necroappetens]
MAADISHVQQLLKYLGSDFLEAEVRQIFRTQGWWQEKIKAAEKSASADRESAPVLQKCAENVCQAVGAEQKFIALQAAYTACLERGPLLRPGATMELEGVMLDHIVAFTDAVLAMGPEEQHAAHIDLEIIHKILNHAVGMEDGDTEPGLKYADALRRLNAWKEENEGVIRQVRLKQFHANVMQDSDAFSFGMFQKIVQLLSFDETSPNELKIQLIEPVAVMLLQLHDKVFAELDLANVEALGKELMSMKSMCHRMCSAQLLPREWMELQLGLVQEYVNYRSVTARLGPDYMDVQAQTDVKLKTAIAQALGHLRSLQAAVKKAAKLVDARKAGSEGEPMQP